MSVVSLCGECSLSSILRSLCIIIKPTCLPPKKGLMWRHSSVQISPPLCQHIKGGYSWWDTRLIISENRGYRITDFDFSKIVISVSLYGAMLTPLLPDKLIWATGSVHTQDGAPGRGHCHTIFWNPAHCSIGFFWSHIPKLVHIYPAQLEAVVLFRPY